MNDAGKQSREIENQLNALLRQVEGMDNKVRVYLADRQNSPHPRHLELLEKIQNFRINPEISNKYLQTMLDNLQWKAYYHSRAWKQLWENAEVKRRNAASRPTTSMRNDGVSGNETAGGGTPGNDGALSGTREKPIYSVDRLWELQKEKLQSLGEKTDPETKQAFVQRIKNQYGRLTSEKRDNEEVYMKFDGVEKRCTLAIRRRD